MTGIVSGLEVALPCKAWFTPADCIQFAQSSYPCEAAGVDSSLGGAGCVGASLGTRVTDDAEVCEEDEEDGLADGLNLLPRVEVGRRGSGRGRGGNGLLNILDAASERAIQEDAKLEGELGGFSRLYTSIDVLTGGISRAFPFDEGGDIGLASVVSEVPALEAL